MEDRLEVINDYMRLVFDGMEPELKELIWEQLLPFPVSAHVLLGEIRRVESGELVKCGF